jgi:putative ABC transport system permease protein
MFQTYFKTALRNFKKHKLHSVINLVGLCLGLTCALYIFVYVHHELSYESFFTHADQIYRIESRTNFSGKKGTLYANTTQNVIPRNLKSVPGVKQQTRFAILLKAPFSLFIKANQKKLAATKVWAADSSFFKIFNFHFIAGNPKTALMHSNGIVLSEQTAQKFFGRHHAIGRSVTLFWRQKKIPLIVRGVVNVPFNTHLQFHAVTSKTVFKDMFGIPMSKAGLAYNYLELKRGQDPVQIAKEIKPAIKNGANNTTYRLEPITRIHLHSHARYELSPNSNIRYIYFLIAIAIILLIIAGINFTSLATAQNLQRYKEAGIRKVLGAQKGQLIGQFLVEVIGISLLALLISYIIADLTLPLFNNFAGVAFHFSRFLTPITLIVFIGGTILLGILAGLYPALLFSAFQPVKTLKGASPSGKKGATIWKSIVVVQFAVSIIMIICTLTIFRQLRFIQHKDLGFNKNHIITFANFMGSHYKVFESRLKNIKGVKNVTVSSYIPGTSKTSGTALVIVPSQADSFTVDWIATDYNYFKTYGIKLKKGRFFSPRYATDSTKAFVVNEAAVKALHLKHPIGAHIIAFGIRNGTIIGVTQNFNFLSLYQKIPPIVFNMKKIGYWNFSVKLAANINPSTVIGRIKHVWQSLLPNTPFKYQFVDQQFNSLYKTDRQMGRVFGIFAILALFLACLGLFSLSSFMAARKKKEIGIRKVLGASITNILFSFYKKYGILVGIACLIAIPASYIFLSRWLQNYAYRIGMPAWVFLIAVVATLFIAFSAVSFESVKAALANPVDSLRKE